MGSGEGRHRLIVTADDFGRSSAVNGAVIRAHREGILTCASVMVGGEAFAEAVELAREHPKLGLGLHLTLCCGKAVLPPGTIPDLVDDAGNFRDSPIAAGLLYSFHSPARLQLAREVEAQLRQFQQTGLTLDHLNGHLHFHLHPVVFGIVRKLAVRYGVRRMRLTREPWERNFVEEEGRWVYRVSHAAVFGSLCAWAAPRFAESGIGHAGQVFGLLENGRVTEDYLLRVIRELPAGVAEVYSHPSLAGGEAELAALTSGRVAEAVRRGDVELIRYQDL